MKLPAASRSLQTRPIVLLLAGAVFINYFDRGNLATASPLLQKELGLSNSELGILFSAFFWSFTQTLGGPRAAGQWMGIQNLCANAAGVLAPLITGFLIHRSNNFFWPFAIAAAVTLLGVLAYTVVIKRVAPVAF
jgi:sugar phosphate permease